MIWACLLGLPTGCAPRVVLDNPQDWPEEWRGRQLCHTPNAYIYASNELLAGEADRLVIAVRREFERETDCRPDKGLVIVTDTGDEAVIKEFRALFKLSKRVERTKEGKPPPTEEELEKLLAGLDKMTEKFGVDLEATLRVSPLLLESADLRSLLGLPDVVAKGADWAVAIPSVALIRDTSRRMMWAMLKKQGAAAVVAGAPLLGMMESMMVNMLAIQRDVALFQSWTRQLEGWTDDEKRELTKAYQEYKQATVMKPLFAKMKKIRPEGLPHATTTTAPTTTPATAPATTTAPD